MNLEFSRQIFEEHSHIKFHENPPSGSRVVPCGRTDRQTLDIICRILCHSQSAVYGALVISAKANKSFDILKLFFLSDLVHRPVFNPLNAKLNPICHLLALLGAPGLK